MSVIGALVYSTMVIVSVVATVQNEWDKATFFLLLAALLRKEFAS